MEEQIRRILIENSGGLKFMALLVQLMKSCAVENLDDNILACIEKMPDIKILKYTYHPLNREKLFVYTP